MKLKDVSVINMKKLLELLLERAYEAQDIISICHNENDMEIVDDNQHRYATNNIETEFGLCAVMLNMLQDGHITHTQREKLSNYLENNKPKRLLNKPLIKGQLVSHSRYYWLPGNWTARIKWLEKYIALA